MNKMTKAMSLLIALQAQAIGLLFAAWYVGDWLNEKHPASFNWYSVTFVVGTLAVAQTFYVVIRKVLREDKGSGDKDDQVRKV